jgi:FAD:protein FMN transferase
MICMNACSVRGAPWAVLLAMFAPWICAADLPLIAWEGQTMGCTYTVKLVDAQLSSDQVDALKGEVEQCLKKVNRQMSHYDPNSDLSRFNRAPANVPFKVPPEFARVIRRGLDLNRLSDGAFDPTLGPVIDLWGFGAKTDLRTSPAEAELRHAMQQTGCQHLSVTPKDELVKDIPKLRLNPSSLVKGFGSDEIVRVLRGHGLTNIYAAISGDIVTCGHNAQGQRWRVGISVPVLNWAPGDPVAAVLHLSSQAVSTSADNEKFFIDAQGRRWGHIFNPKTGHPVQHKLASVSVVADSCMTSSSLATTLFVLGPEAGSRFIEDLTNAAALFIVRDPDGKTRSMPSSRFAAVTAYDPSETAER